MCRSSGNDQKSLIDIPASGKTPFASLTYLTYLYRIHMDAFLTIIWSAQARISMAQARARKEACIGKKHLKSIYRKNCHIGGPIGVNPGNLALVYGSSHTHSQWIAVRNAEWSTFKPQIFTQYVTNECWNIRLWFFVFVKHCFLFNYLKPTKQ